MYMDHFFSSFYILYSPCCKSSNTQISRSRDNKGLFSSIKSGYAYITPQEGVYPKRSDQVGVKRPGHSLLYKNLEIVYRMCNNARFLYVCR